MDEPKTQFSQFPQIGGSESAPIIPTQGKLGLIIKIVAGVVGVAIVGGGIALGARIWDPLWNPFRPEPEEVLEEMFANMKEIESLRLEIEVRVEQKGTSNDSQIFLSFRIDSADTEKPKANIDFNLLVEGEKPGQKITLVGEVRQIDKNSYFKLTTIDLPSEIEMMLAMFGIDLNKIKGKWIKGSSKEKQVKNEEQKAMQEKIKKVFTDTKIYYVKEELADEKINGEKYYHYLLALDNEKIKEMLPELFEISAESSEQTLMPGGGFSSAALGEAMAESLEEFLDKVGEITADFWIGKKDLLLYRVEAEKEIDLAKVEKAGKGTLSIEIGMNLSNFNEPVTVEEPKDSVNLEDLISLPSLFPDQSSTP